MFIEQRTVSRKTPKDGKLEISAGAAARLESLGDTFPLRTESGEGRARLHSMSCTCEKSASSGQHLHHFVESDVLRTFEPGSDVRVAIDDARPGSLFIESVRSSD
jgi:hypothetical protein